MNPTTNTEAGAVADVAAKLTEAQRGRVVRSDVLVIRNGHDARVAVNLKRKGILELGRHRNQFVLTPLGLAVRQHLEQGATAGVAEMNEQMFGQGD